MLRIGARVKITDNTGGRIGKIIGVPGSSRERVAKLGSVVRVSITKANPYGLVKEHGKERAVVVRTRKEYRRRDGSYIRFDDNAAVVLGSDGKTPKGTRVFGPIARELKENGYDKIVSLAPEVI
ncbi:MAG: 50S ribosomal protein L14 [bacterium]